MKKYSEKLKDPRWQKIRLKVLERDEWACVNCGEDKSMLAVHHKIYKNGKNPWDYKLTDLITLCDECHREQSESMDNDYAFLIEDLKTIGFLYGDIDSLRNGIYNSTLYKGSRDFHPAFPAAIGSAFEIEEIQQGLLKLYFDHLKKKYDN